MGEAVKKICLASVQAQSRLEWIGECERRTNPELDLKLGISNTYSAQARGNYNHSIDQAEKNLINGSSTTPGASVSFNTIQTCERQTSKPRLDLKVAKQKEDLKRLKRMMSNRVSSEKYRKKKMLYMDHLENQLRTLRLEISNILNKIQQTKNLQQLLLIEQHQVKLQIATFEKERIIKEVEIEKNIAEGNRLRQLRIDQSEATQDAKPNSDGGLNAINAKLDLNL